MHKLLLPLPLLTVAALGWQAGHEPPHLHHLKEEALTIEYTASADEVTVVFEAESEHPIHRVEVRDPQGEVVLRLSGGAGADRAMSGFVVESLEGDLTSVREAFPEGVYEILARTGDGQGARGSARLSHVLPRAPVFLYPRDGEVGVATDALLTWMADPAAVSFHVNLEQGDSDGLRVQLPRGTTSFQVPAGVLARGTPTFVEVGAVAQNGNVTVTEVEFTTH